MTPKFESERRKLRRLEAKECPVHAYQTHGKEAQELRKAIEELVECTPDPYDVGEMSGEEARERLREARRILQELLEEVDARDSHAYMDRCSYQPVAKKRTRPSTKKSKRKRAGAAK